MIVSSDQAAISAKMSSLITARSWPIPRSLRIACFSKPVKPPTSTTWEILCSVIKRIWALAPSFPTGGSTTSPSPFLDPMAEKSKPDCPNSALSSEIMSTSAATRPSAPAACLAVIPSFTPIPTGAASSNPARSSNYSNRCRSSNASHPPTLATQHLEISRPALRSRPTLAAQIALSSVPLRAARAAARYSRPQHVPEDKIGNYRPPAGLWYQKCCILFDDHIITP